MAIPLCHCELSKKARQSHNFLPRNSKSYNFLPPLPAGAINRKSNFLPRYPEHKRGYHNSSNF
ncbi:MAG: hypothetical protein HWN79_18825 [Candidatus Lokiarchaeota archaeon]|nr:hypothetical protein [Candidatus Lokiarchaeota archaeon]